MSRFIIEGIEVDLPPEAASRVARAGSVDGRRLAVSPSVYNAYVLPALMKRCLEGIFDRVEFEPRDFRIEERQLGDWDITDSAIHHNGWQRSRVKAPTWAPADDC